jgi:hypothetical protein
MPQCCLQLYFFFKLLISDKYGEIENNKWGKKIKFGKLEEEKVKNCQQLSGFFANIKDIELFQWESKVNYDSVIESSCVRHG